jgi:hypothetical protein
MSGALLTFTRPAAWAPPPNASPLLAAILLAIMRAAM